MQRWFLPLPMLTQHTRRSVIFLSRLNFSPLRMPSWLIDACVLPRNGPSGEYTWSLPKESWWAACSMKRIAADFLDVDERRVIRLQSWKIVHSRIQRAPSSIRFLVYGDA